MNIIGIDTGKSGSLCHLKDNIPIEFIDFSSNNLRGYINYLKSLDSIDLCVVELVHSMPSQGVKSMFSFGENFGMLQGMLMSLNIPFILVRPTIWKKALHIPAKSDKKASASIIQNIFPTVDLYTPRGRLLDGRSDALCLAYYGQLHLKGKLQ